MRYIALYFVQHVFRFFSMITVKNINSSDAWTFLQENKEALLIDVRTPEEWINIGRPDLKKLNNHLYMISWLFFPEKNLNADFMNELNKVASNQDVPLLFLCKSGVRSEAAAKCAIDKGYTNCFNIIDGFEGSSPVLKGWKGNLLPIFKGST